MKNVLAKFTFLRLFELGGFQAMSIPMALEHGPLTFVAYIIDLVNLNFER